MGPLILPTWSKTPSTKAWPKSVVVLQVLVGKPVCGSFRQTVTLGKYEMSTPPRFSDASEGLGSPVPMSKGVGWYTAGHQAAGRDIVVDSGYTGNVDGE
jgi:hypothetical protein